MFSIDNIQDIRDMARGAVLLGTGGGGDPYIGELFVGAQIKAGRHPRIVSCEELADDAFVVSIAGIGAPSVLVEHLLSEQTLLRLLDRAETYYGRRIGAFVSAEIGGANSMFPLALGAISDIPVLDADGIGRAVPHVEMTKFSICGCRATPALLMDDSGNVVTIESVDDRTAEELSRAATGALGAMALGAFYPMSGRQAKVVAVQRTITQTLEIGRCIRTAREASRDIFASLLDYLNGWEGRMAQILFDGKVVDVMHETRDGWHFGRATLRGMNESSDECVIDIQNEFLVARVNARTVTIVPDLITVLDRESGEPLTGEMLSYGQRVKVLGFSADPALRRAESLAVLGPRQFGLDEDYRPIEALVR